MFGVAALLLIGHHVIGITRRIFNHFFMVSFHFFWFGVEESDGIGLQSVVVGLIVARLDCVIQLIIHVRDLRMRMHSDIPLRTCLITLILTQRVPEPK